jgi:hypothetical protein
MAWDEQRRLRGAQRGDTAEIEGLPVGGDSESIAPDARTPAAGRGARIEAWGQRFGWMAAVALSVIALALAGFAFANSGTTATAGFGQQRGFTAPYGGNGGPYRHGGGPGLGFGQPQ